MRHSGYNGASASQPQAYLNWVLVDEQYGYVPEGSGYVQAGSSTGLQTLATGEIEVVKSGYLTVFVSNQSSSYKAYFDNLSIEHRTGPLLAEDDYYPFGLKMAGISSKAAGRKENREKTFQGQQFDDDFGLDWHQFKWRNHDPQIGRFIEVDPLSDKYVYNSTYAFSENKVVRHVEIEGLESADYMIGLFKKAVANEFISTSKSVDNTLSVHHKVTSSVEVGSSPTASVSVGQSFTTTVSFNFGGIIEYIARNNSSAGINEPLIKQPILLLQKPKQNAKL